MIKTSSDLRSFLFLCRKEVFRFLKVPAQTVFQPIWNALLFYYLFTLLAKTRGLEGFNQEAFSNFIIPGLISMQMIQNSSANAIASIMFAKMQGTIFDLLVAPVSNIQIITSFIVGGIVRAFFTGLVIYAVFCLFHPMWFYNFFIAMLFLLLSAVIMSLLGLIAGLVSDKFDQVSVFTSLIIMPLSFLSGTFYSIKIFPPFLYNISLWNPFFYVTDGFRYGMIGIKIMDDIYFGVFFLLMWAFLLMLITYFLFKSGYKIRN